MGKQNAPKSESGRRARKRVGLAPSWRSFAEKLAVLAIFLQCAIVQTHIHAPAQNLAGFVAAEAGGAPAASLTNHDEQAPAVCATCLEATLSSGYAPAATPALPAPPSSSSRALATRATPGGGARLSHAWRSRAPPSLT